MVVVWRVLDSRRKRAILFLLDGQSFPTAQEQSTRQRGIFIWRWRHGVVRYLCFAGVFPGSELHDHTIRQRLMGRRLEHLFTQTRTLLHVFFFMEKILAPLNERTD